MGLEDDAKRNIVISTLKTTGLLLHKFLPTGLITVLMKLAIRVLQNPALLMVQDS